MQIVPFGPIVTQTMLTPQETKYFLDSFYKSKIQEVSEDVIITHNAAWLDITNQVNDIFRPHIENYLNMANWEGNNKITSLWGNIYKSRDWINPHVHRDCDLSFTLIVKAPPHELLNNTKREGCLIFTYGETPSWSQKIKPITHQGFLPIEGELFIFPQNLNHYTIPIVHPQMERISISGNIALD